MSSATTKPSISPEQYEAIEEKSEIRHEYDRGEMFAMAGATENHGLIAGNLFRALGNHFEGRPCKAFMNDMRIRVNSTGFYTDPDVAAVRGPSVFNLADKKRRF
jgi:Uma2 family endonuclease